MSQKDLKEICQKYDGRVAKLLKLGRDDLMRSNENNRLFVKKFGFAKEDIPQLLQLAQDMELFEFEYDYLNDDEIDESFGVVYSWYILSELESPEFKGILIKMLENGDEDNYNDWILDDFYILIWPYIDGMYPYFAKAVVDTEHSTWVRSSYFQTIEEMVKNNEVSLEEVKKLLQTILKESQNEVLNAHVISFCVDNDLQEYHQLIKECFQRDAVDLMFMGDLEDVEIRMGIREQRVTQKELTMLDNLFGNFTRENDKLLEIRANRREVGRNEPCPCGSGKKYKKCCLGKG